MKKFKFYQFVLALVAAVLISAAASELNTASAAPAAPATNLQDVVPSNQVDVQHWRRRRNRWVGPAIALGVVGAAAAAAAANQNYYYNQNPGYYEQQPYGYYQPQRRQRCWVQTDPVYNRGYWAWC